MLTPALALARVFRHLCFKSGASAGIFIFSDNDCLCLTCHPCTYMADREYVFS